MMSVAEKNELSLIYARTCKTFDKVLEPDVLRMIIEDLSDLGFEEVVQALNQYRLDEKSIYWPRANKIRAICRPVQSLDSLSNEVSSRIREAITKFGYSNPNEAKEFIGDLGWDLVRRYGGWVYICENHGVEFNSLTFHAQTRDMAKGAIESAQIGKYNQPIGIPEPKQNEKLTNVHKLITIKEVPK